MRRTVFFKLILQLSVIVLSFVVNTFWVSVKKESYNYKQEVVNQYSTGVPPFVVEPPPLWFRLCSSQRAPDPFHFIRPRLILWDPICQRTLNSDQLTGKMVGRNAFYRTRSHLLG